MSRPIGSFSAVLDVLLPPRCVMCDIAGAAMCRRCVLRLTAPANRRAPEGLDDLVALCAYDGAGRELVLALKRRNRRCAVGVIAAACADAVPQWAQHRPPAVTWAPTTDRRRRRRGFDQSQVLASAVAAATGWRSTRLLAREGAAQSGRDRVARMDHDIFVASKRAPLDVVVVDDVVTTGATMSAAASALRGAGARRVLGIAIALAA